jgi:hypothetical protein
MFGDREPRPSSQGARAHQKLEPKEPGGAAEDFLEGEAQMVQKKGPHENDPEPQDGIKHSPTASAVAKTTNRVHVRRRGSALARVPDMNLALAGYTTRGGAMPVSSGPRVRVASRLSRARETPLVADETTIDSDGRASNRSWTEISARSLAIGSRDARDARSGRLECHGSRRDLWAPGIPETGKFGRSGLAKTRAGPATRPPSL